MAEVIQYYYNNDRVSYSEGPFVVVRSCFNYRNYRIEVHRRGHHCPVLPDLSIDRLVGPLHWMPKEQAIALCDRLNRLVADKHIHEDEFGVWAPTFAGSASERRARGAA